MNYEEVRKNKNGMLMMSVLFYITAIGVFIYGMGVIIGDKFAEIEAASLNFWLYMLPCLVIAGLLLYGGNHHYARYKEFRNELRYRDAFASRVGSS